MKGIVLAGTVARGSMTHEININGIIIRLRNLSASLNKLIKTQKIMPNEKEKVIKSS